MNGNVTTLSGWRASSTKVFPATNSEESPFLSLKPPPEGDNKRPLALREGTSFEVSHLRCDHWPTERFGL
jgi:hypothetical protein